jgi:archaellum component FlaC
MERRTKTELHDNKRRINQLEKENKRLKKLYTNLSLDHENSNNGL